jgi:hypothetical protein
MRLEAAGAPLPALEVLVLPSRDRHVNRSYLKSKPRYNRVSRRTVSP